MFFSLYGEDGEGEGELWFFIAFTIYRYCRYVPDDNRFYFKLQRFLTPTNYDVAKLKMYC